MTKLLFKQLLVLAALFISLPALAEENPISQSVPLDASALMALALPTTPALTRIKRGEICPPVPTAWSTWPAEGVSLIGGCTTTSKQQRFHALKWELPYSHSETAYQNLKNNGTFVALVSNSYLNVEAHRPYVRLETVRFVEGMALAYSKAQCGILVVTGAGRLVTEVYRGSSPDTVHPFGMAVDLRLRDVEQRCADWIRMYVREKEAQKLIDATEHGHEKSDLHMHVVVVPSLPAIQMAQSGTYPVGVK